MAKTTKPKSSRAAPDPKAALADATSTGSSGGDIQTILVIDPDQDFLVWMKGHLGNPRVKVLTTTSADDAVRHFRNHSADLIITEVRVEPVNGLEVLRQARQLDPNAMVLLLTDFPQTNAVIESMRMGAFDFLGKETLHYELRSVVENALKASEDRRATLESAPELAIDNYQESIVGKSQAMQNVFKMIGRVSRSDAPVMITGESGCGKEIVARAIYKFSPRSRNDFVAINCAAIPENLLESELFGHERGAFTGATQQRVGRFEQCDGGTLFLDEIGDMPMQVQSKILRVLQEGEFSRVGGNETLKTDVRILAATNKKLEREVDEGTFREDLFYRLNVVRLHIPPLRERREDVRPLANFFLQRICQQRRVPRMRFSKDAMAALENYRWPGNVRELENTIQRAVALANTDVLLARDIPLGGRDQGGMLPAATAPADRPAGAADESPREKIDQAVATLFAAAQSSDDFDLLPWLEREMIRRAMAETGSNQLQAAKLLGINRATLRSRLEKMERNEGDASEG